MQSVSFSTDSEVVRLNPAAAAAERTLVIERVFDAPRSLVFEAWTKPEHLAHWWGPNEFTLPFCEMDFRPGGRYRYCMRSPEGVDHWVWGEFRNIVPPEQLAFTWNREDSNGTVWNSTVVDLSFSDAGGKTNFLLRQTNFETVTDRNDHRGGWTECLERLNSYVSAIAAATD